MAKINADLYTLLANNRKALLAAGLLASNPAVVAIDAELAKHTQISGKMFVAELDELVVVLREKIRLLKDSKDGAYTVSKLKSDFATQLALIQSKLASAPTA